MSRTVGSLLIAALLASFSMLLTSCGGGGGSTEEVVPGRVTFSNSCTNTTFDVYIGNTKLGTIAPGQSVASDVVPGLYTLKECVVNTTTCDTVSDAISSRENLTVYTCPTS